MTNFRKRGLFPIKVDLEPHNQMGLFGVLLTLASQALVGGQKTASLEFKVSLEDNKHLYDFNEYYNYVDDLEYRIKVRSIIDRFEHNQGKRDSNLHFLKKLDENGLTLLPDFLMRTDIRNPQPAPAPHPREEERTSFIFPSYIIWKNDETYYSFFGSPERLEFPKDVLRKTTGHPQYDPQPLRSHGLRIYPRWEG